MTWHILTGLMTYDVAEWKVPRHVLLGPQSSSGDIEGTTKGRGQISCASSSLPTRLLPKLLRLPAAIDLS
ncbi:hypothetical protein F2Q70_00009532 [Brassica cretica]|uniref:Uncharacterized protein n=3 Tax=Brassica TaxID=3705 RepID=A0A8S9J5G6_BRACR|nr:hypothetical protein F2Q68_00002561 [Brassica cretica]KAF2611548.1 hypothetical protein F2Q70_00009532 [Brassica cretica]KAF3508875.1 hypothetical protein F2Q69_00002938 [Brassica cretica]KAF3551347.1 hypothetical protein DY000_02003530 [Brassica cretica]